ncbi:Acid alpha-amylase protein [Rutstroemia sp. NJR-2017a BBW]|nr:Acid alpha-amylase protein [Rutstroemia sp. NJR-2017a BBW]
MVDVVANHMGSDATANTVDYSIMHPFNSSSYFHSVCFINDNNNQTQIEHCLSIAGLEYHSTGCARFAYLLDQVPGLNIFNKHQVDGLRVDTVRHVEKSFWPLFNNAAGVYCFMMAMWIISAITRITWTVYFHMLREYFHANVPMMSIHKQVRYFQLVQFFTNSAATSKNLIGQFQAQSKKCRDTTLLGSFTENHDLPRFGNLTSDLALAKNIVTYTMLTDGIPIICSQISVYQGQEQHFHGGTDPYDREPLWPTNYNTTSPLYVLVKQLNAIRSLAIARSNTYSTTQTKVVYADDHNIAFQKGDSKSMVLMVLNNLGEKAQNYTVKMGNVGFKEGLQVTDVLSCRNATVDDRGGLDVRFIGGLPSALAGADSDITSKYQASPIKVQVQYLSERENLPYPKVLHVRKDVDDHLLMKIH